MSLFTVERGFNFGYFETFDEAYEIAFGYPDAVVKEIKCDEYKSNEIYIIGSSNDEFFIDVRSASLFTGKYEISMIPEIFVGMENSKSIYGLAYMFYLRAMKGIDDLDEAFDIVTRRGDLYRIKKGVFGIPEKMNYLPDKITDNYRLIYMMADNYAKLDDSLGRTNQDDYYEFDIHL
uniref:Uncharacterized protein n=1 Tax=Pithovirus LCPAC403 TaxID=2506596 RepID=A0A481ZAC9_9VIRU|nr:MAG: hypothetical protein LCPAC403_00070 [Pithovirus LCPAC403]